MSMAEDWWVYVLVSRDGRRTYVGIARDVDARLARHNGDGPGGAKSTRAGRPWSLAAKIGPYADRGRVQTVEARLKQARGYERLSWAARLHAWR